MSEILYGGPVAERLRGELRGRIDALLARGVRPCLAIVRVGEAPVSLSYERAMLHACEKLGTAVRCVQLPADCSTETLAETLRAVSAGLELLKPDGLMTICVYPGHEEGARELSALMAWAAGLDDRRFDALVKGYLNQPNDPPRLIAIRRKRTKKDQTR